MLLVIIQCEKPVERRAIDTGSPLTILAPQSDSPIHFIEWYFGIKPLNSKSGLSVTFESVRFTPDYPGEYDVVVELFNDKNDVLEFKVFKYIAVGPRYEKELSTPIKHISEIDSNVLDLNIDTRVDSNMLPQNNNDDSQQIVEQIPQYTIQVFSLPDEGKADAKLNKLKDEGYNAYKVEFIHPKYNATWYRIRVGEFVEFSYADSVAKKIDSRFNITTWIDRLKK